MEGAVGEAVDEGVDAHGEDGGVGGEEEGGEGVAEAGEEEEEVSSGAFESVSQDSREDAACKTSHGLQEQGLAGSKWYQPTSGHPALQCWRRVELILLTFLRDLTASGTARSSRKVGLPS